MTYCQFSQREQYRTTKYCQSVLAVAPAFPDENILLSICAAVITKSTNNTLTPVRIQQ